MVAGLVSTAANGQWIKLFNSLRSFAEPTLERFWSSDRSGGGGDATASTERAAGAAGFSAAEREAVLEILRECADSLTVHRNTLRRATAGGAFADAFPEIGISETSILQSPTGDAAARMTDSRREAEREKLRRDSLYVADIIRDLMREISERGTIEVLIGEIEGIASREKQERLLSEERERMLAIVAELRKTIADKRASYEEREGRLTRQLTLTRDETERLKLIKDLEMRYVSAWEKARREQNALRYELETEALAKTLNDRRTRERNERRANGELTRYLTQRITFVGKRIDEWRRRYDREWKMYEKEIGKARNEIEDARRNLEELTTEYRVNQEFIDAYLAEREVVRRQKEREEHVRRSAIRMQAWWRGVMVRRKLGPYRPEEKRRKRPIKAKK